MFFYWGLGVSLRVVARRGVGWVWWGWGGWFGWLSFWVRTRATIGGTSQQIATLIQRKRLPDGRIEVVPVERWRNAAVPPGAPAFPTKS